ncbi:MAG TPA: hypothetical protein VMA73_29985 [Streptosporangiaceae bacterium]|nr:hypothetical protein [Streptosporangiaceae bacterium]
MTAGGAAARAGPHREANVAARVVARTSPAACIPDIHGITRALLMIRITGSAGAGPGTTRLPLGLQ